MFLAMWFGKTLLLTLSGVQNESDHHSLTISAPHCLPLCYPLMTLSFQTTPSFLSSSSTSHIFSNAPPLFPPIQISPIFVKIKIINQLSLIIKLLCLHICWSHPPMTLVSQLFAFSENGDITMIPVTIDFVFSSPASHPLRMLNLLFVCTAAWFLLIICHYFHTMCTFPNIQR